MAKNKIVVKTEVDNSELEDGLDEAKDIVEDKGDEGGNAFAKGFGKGTSKIKSKMSSVFTKGLSKATGLATGLLTTIKSIVSAIGSAGVALGVVGVIGGLLVAGATILMGAFKKLTEDGSEFKTNLQYLIFAIQTALQPAINVVADVLTQILKIIIKIIQYVAVLIKMLTGYNIFENATPEAFAKSMEEANANSKGTAKNMKEIKKQLAGFDEMNVLQDNTGAGVGGANIGVPTIDLSDLTTAETEVQKFIADWQKFGKEMEETLNLPLEAWFKAFGNWGLAVRGVTEFVHGLWEAINGIFQFLGGVLDVIVGLITGDTEKVKKGIYNMLDGLWHVIDGLLKAVWGLIQTVVGLILGIVLSLVDVVIGLVRWCFEETGKILVNVGAWVWDNVLMPVYNFFVEVGKWIVNTVVSIVTGAYNILVGIGAWVYNNVIKPVADFFVNLWNGIIEGVKNAVKWVKDTFNSIVGFFSGIINTILGFFRKIGTSVGDAVGGAFKGIINSVLDWITNKINGFLKSINNAIDYINAIPLVNIPKLKMVSFPRLAKGGIVNNPGPGVMMGSYIAGERGPEAVLPLNDETFERLGIAIGRHTSINATIPIYVGNRQIARELRKIDAEDNFAFNR